MIWSVSTLLPNFQARPRTSFGSVTVAFPRRPALPGDRPVTTKAKTMGARGGVSVGGACPPCAFSSHGPGRLWAASPDCRGHFLQHLAGVGDDACDGARRGHRRI